jgi:hypothetical protein
MGGRIATRSGLAFGALLWLSACAHDDPSSAAASSRREALAEPLISPPFFVGPPAYAPAPAVSTLGNVSFGAGSYFVTLAMDRPGSKILGVRIANDGTPLDPYGLQLGGSSIAASGNVFAGAHWVVLSGTIRWSGHKASSHFARASHPPARCSIPAASGSTWTP